MREKKKQKMRRKRFFWLLVMLIAVFGLWYQENHTLNIKAVFQSEEKNQEGTESKTMIPLFTYDPLDCASFGIYEKDIIQSTKDGIKRLTIDGKTLWSYAYFMNRPFLMIHDAYIGVVDIGGNKAAVLGDKGEIYTIETLYPILQCTLSQQGSLAIVQQTTTGHQISVYNKEGHVLMDHITYVEKDGQPINIVLSPDGDQLVTSYVDTNGSEVLSKLTFFNMGDGGEQQVDSISGSYHYPNMLIPEGNFLDNHTFIAIGDEKMISFNVDINPVEYWSNVFSHKIRRVSMEGNKSFALAFGDPLAGKDGKGEEGEVTRIYNKQGKMVGEQFIQSPVDYLYHTDHITIVGVGRTFYGLNTKGRVLWDYTATKDIKAFLPFDNKNFLVVSTEQVEIVQIK